MEKVRETTIYDIAKKLNISPATVSRGMQDHPSISKKTKKKIFELVEERGIDQITLPAIYASNKRTPSELLYMN